MDTIIANMFPSHQIPPLCHVSLQLNLPVSVWTFCVRMREERDKTVAFWNENGPS